MKIYSLWFILILQIRMTSAITIISHLIRLEKKYISHHQEKLRKRYSAVRDSSWNALNLKKYTEKKRLIFMKLLCFWKQNLKNYIISQSYIKYITSKTYAQKKRKLFKYHWSGKISKINSRKKNNLKSYRHLCALLRQRQLSNFRFR